MQIHPIDGLTTLNYMKQRLSNLIADGNTEEVIHLLRSLDPGLRGELRKDVLMLSNRYKTLIREKNHGILTAEQQGVQLASINAALLGIISQLPDVNSYSDDLTPSVPYTPVSPGMSQVKWPLMLMGSLMLVIITGFGGYYGVKKIITDDEKQSSLSDDTSHNDTDSGGDIPVINPNPDVVGPSPSEDLPKSKPEKEEPQMVPVSSLKVSTNSEAHESLFKAKASEMLNRVEVSHTSRGEANARQVIKFTFDLDIAKTSAGMRDAFEYSLSLEVSVVDPNNQVCGTKFYLSDKPLIGYPQDSEGIIRQKIIIPFLNEIINKFQSDPPLFC